MVKYSVRAMVPEDIDAVFEIETQSFKTPWTYESLEREILFNEIARYLVLVIDEKVCGYAGFWIIFDEAHITNIAVRREWRGMGYGKILVNSLIDYARNIGMRAMTLEVRANNDIALALYTHLGFLRSGIRPNYYADEGQDAVIMWKYLEGNE